MISFFNWLVLVLFLFFVSFGLVTAQLTDLDKIILQESGYKGDVNKVSFANKLRLILNLYMKIILKMHQKAYKFIVPNFFNVLQNQKNQRQGICLHGGK